MKTFEPVQQETKLVEVWLCRDLSNDELVAWPIEQGDTLSLYYGRWMTSEDINDDWFYFTEGDGSINPKKFCKMYGCQMKDLPRKGRKIRAMIRVTI